MEREIYTIPAAQLSLEAVADIFSHAFEGYYYPGTITAPDLARRVRIEQIDLWRSPVLVEGERPVGIALLALRGDDAWCGGFGVYTAARGRGLAHTLAAALIEQARESGAATIGLEVLTRNDAAIRTYQRAGLTIWRDLHLFEWRRPEGWRAVVSPEVREARPLDLLSHYAALHLVPAAWQRDLPALLVMSKLRGITIDSQGGPAGYALFQGDDGGRIRIVDLAARERAAAEALLNALQSHAESLVSINEPSDNPLTAAYPALGFNEIDRQHEMRLALR